MPYKVSLLDCIGIILFSRSSLMKKSIFFPPKSGYLFWLWCCCIEILFSPWGSLYIWTGATCNMKDFMLTVNHILRKVKLFFFKKSLVWVISSDFDEVSKHFLLFFNQMNMCFLCPPLDTTIPYLPFTWFFQSQSLSSFPGIGFPWLSPLLAFSYPSGNNLNITFL